MNTEKLHKTNFTILWICAAILITFLTISRGLTQQTIISDGGMLICMLIVTGLYFFKRLGDVVRGTGMTVIIAIGCVLVSVSEGGNSASFVMSYIPLGMALIYGSRRFGVIWFCRNSSLCLDEHDCACYNQRNDV